MTNSISAKTNPTLFDRGRAAQRKTVEGIFEFASCVLELKESANTTQGGTDFAKLCKKEWGISESVTSKFLAISKSERLSSVERLLPSSYNTLYSIAIMPDDVFNKALDERVISPSATGTEITQLV